MSKPSKEDIKHALEMMDAMQVCAGKLPKRKQSEFLKGMMEGLLK